MLEGAATARIEASSIDTPSTAEQQKLIGQSSLPASRSEVRHSLHI